MMLTRLIEKILGSIPYLRRPLYQRDAARAELASVRNDLAAARIEIAQLKGRISPAIRSLFDRDFWFLLPDEDDRQDRAIGDLRAYVGKTVPKDCASLEIGPSYNPMLAKRAGYRVTIIDHADQAALIGKYRPHGVDVANIEPVDIVWDGRPLKAVVGGRGFDAIVAAHVVEHAPDFVQFLNDCASILNERGSIHLLVPDKRYAYDFFQPLSDVAKVLADHRAGRTRHTFESFYRQSVCVKNGGDIAWGQAGITALAFASGDPAAQREGAEESLKSDIYVDVHENYFTPVSFAILIDELRYLGEIALELKVLTRPRGCEFLAVLQKAVPGENPPVQDYLARKMQAYALLTAEEHERVNSAAKLIAG